MLITRTSPLTRKVTTLDLDVTEAQMDEMESPIYMRRFVQDIFPNLSHGEREFIKSGYTPADWKVMFPEQDEG